MRVLQHRIDTDAIKLFLADRPHKVVNIHNIIYRITNKSLPMFFIDIKSEENIKEVYKQAWKYYHQKRTIT